MDLDDVVRLIPQDRRTRSQWHRIGTNHGQALLARVLRDESLPPDLVIPWLLAAIAGFEVEEKRAIKVEKFYWSALIETMIEYGLHVHEVNVNRVS